MKHFKIIFIAMLAIVSCQLEEDFQQIDNNAVPMTFYAGIELPEDHVETKTILGGSPSDKYRKVLWETDDEVYVTNETYSSKFINTAENGANLAILEGELSQGSKYLAAYPYDIVTDYTSGAFNVNLPTVQEYYEDGINPGTFPMVAKCNNGTFNFQNICGIFVLQLLGEKTVSALTFSGEGETGNLLSVAGNGTVSMDYDDHPTLNLNESSSKTVKLNCSNGVALNIENPTLFHIILPDGIYRNFKVVVEATDGSIMTITSTKPLRIKRSTRTTAAELTYGDVINLSEEGTANCYIVNNPGNYSFDASVKGNSLETVGTVSTTEVLWESFGTNVKPEVGGVVKNVKYEDGKIKFDIPVNYNEGNAVVAVKNTSGTILWSWHIWVTDKPDEYTYPNNAGVMMDRNLGATSATPGDVGALGLFYEWGRKDPFLGSSSIKSNTVAESTLNWPTAVDNTASTGTIQYSIENPTTFIRSNSSLNGDWLNTRNDQVWQTEKTKYDPCPPGWKVPDGGPNGFFKIAGFDDTMFDQTNCGIYFNCESSVESWFPAAGQHNGDNISGEGTNGLYAGNRYNGGFTYRLSFRLTENELTGDVAAHGVGGRGVGHSVRCVKEVSGPSADITECIDLSANETANSYLVSEVGSYKFNASVKGNTNEEVGTISNVEVLWESFGTDYPPLVGEVIKNVGYENGYIRFDTPSRLTEGNAVVAVKDASGTILWSWHIWFTDKPVEHVYPNGTGIMMDRNLGATSATPGDVCALGLLYQWGRKDPFLNSYAITGVSSEAIARATGEWYTAYVGYDIGTVQYVIEHPTTFIIPQDYNDREWLYYSNSTLWGSEKTKYDPCPPGWQVPSSSSIWTDFHQGNYKFDESNCGVNLQINSNQYAWYPAAGYSNWYLRKTGEYGLYRYTSPGYMKLNKSGASNLSLGKGDAMSVRCIKTGSVSNGNDTPTIDLSSFGTANSYIISSPGKYKFNASVKGNSSESIGEAVSSDVIWESFGTEVTPSIGDIVRNISYKDGYIEFETPSELAEGNAVIAAKDVSGTILWSWHIWVTDQPTEHTYPKNSGIMMDRNLGATSATPGDVGALGLLYQWGRKDPFLNSSSINEDVIAESTGTWSSINAGSSTGNIAYITKNPTTYIRAYATDDYDWFYHNPNNDLWSSSKSMYDPCPKGWKVPNDLYTWNACDSYSFDQQKGGSYYVLDGQISAWYPAAGDTYNGNSITSIGDFGGYWTCAIGGYNKAKRKYTHSNDYNTSGRAYGSSVRCMKEDSSNPSTETPEEYKNLSIDGTSNSYIISKPGKYKFKGWVKGNSSESVGVVDRAEVLWESFGTDVTPAVGDIVRNISYKDGYIEFETPSSFVEGNALIAVKDASGTILWSWHIWATDNPTEQVYYNNAGTVMDRNLGATSATPGDVGALGLLYQWGRKDPFLGSSSISSNVVAESTITWPSYVSSSPETGTISYATENPTTFITYYYEWNTSHVNYDWYYTGTSQTGPNRWRNDEKTNYDPCPPGWKVPKGGESGLWSTAIKSTLTNDRFSYSFDKVNFGMNLSGKFSQESNVWYPASGYRSYSDGSLKYVSESGFYWSSSSGTYDADLLSIHDDGDVWPETSNYCAVARSVRCVKE